MITSAIFGTLGFLVLGLLAAWIGKKLLDLDSPVVYGSLFFAPIFAYVVFSGQLQEFKGPGFEAKFREIANKKIEVRAPIQEALGGKKHGEMQALFAGGSDIAVLDVEELAKRGEAGVFPIAFQLGEQIAASLSQGTFEMLIALDGKKRVVAYLPKHWFLDLLALPDIHTSRGNDPDFDQTNKVVIERALRKTYLWDILVRPERVKEWGKTKVISNDASYIQAYQALSNENLTAMPVVDSSGTYVGILRLRDAKKKLIGALIDPEYK